MVKTCTRCGTAKSLDQFYLVKGRRESRCKDCENARRRLRDRMRYTSVSDITAEQELAMRKRARKCPLCSIYMTGKPGKPNSKHLDHILPLNQGGTHTHGNVRVICADCNLKRPKDGSDYTGMLTLWAQGEVPIARPRKRGYSLKRKTCRKKLHPWTPENVGTGHGGARYCIPCLDAKPTRRASQKTCKCGAPFTAPGAQFMCTACIDAAAHKAAELHASGLSWQQVAEQVGYTTDEGARYAAKRIGYTPAKGAPKGATAKGAPKACGCGQPVADARGRPGSRQSGPLCQACRTARAWQAVELRLQGQTLEVIASQLGYTSKSSVTNLISSVTVIDSQMRRPRNDDEIPASHNVMAQ